MKVGQLWNAGLTTTDLGLPLVCGGFVEGPGVSKDNPTCTVYDPERDSWRFWSEYPAFSGGAAAVKSPNGSFWILQGTDTFYQKDHKFTPGVPAPEYLWYGCAMYLNDSATVAVEDEFHIFNHVSMEWTNISSPSGHKFDAGLACGMIQGRYAAFIKPASDYVALLDVRSQVWSEGPVFPNGTRAYSTTVPYRDSFLVVGGYTQGYRVPTDEIYFLNGTSMAWELMPHKMSQPRVGFYAALVPDEFVECI